MGPYCMYCDHRCFVLRVIPGTGQQLLLATCAAGMDHDQIKTGYTHETAINPLSRTAFRIEVPDA